MDTRFLYILHLQTQQHAMQLLFIALLKAVCQEIYLFLFDIFDINTVYYTLSNSATDKALNFIDVVRVTARTTLV